jgi:hypothetical protein
MTRRLTATTIIPSRNEISLAIHHTAASSIRCGVLQSGMPHRKQSPDAMPRKAPEPPAAGLHSLRRHIETCLAAFDHHGTLAAEDLRRATARWPELRTLPTKTALRLALYRLDNLMAEQAPAVPEQAPAAVTGAGGAQPVPPQAPTPPRQQPAPETVVLVRDSPRDRRERRDVARRVVSADAVKRCGTVVDLSGFEV